jgi:nitrite reductase/ring-hydroxylating ferredoxin subunit
VKRLCALRTLPNDRAAMLSVGTGDEQTDVLLVRQGRQVHGFVNECPHMGVKLDEKPDRVVVGRGAFLRCSHHGALFRIADGLCVSGPCRGDRLVSLPLTIVGGMVMATIDDGVSCRA